MPSSRSAPVVAVFIAVLLLAPVAEASSGKAGTAALQVALRGLRLYGGPIDGVAGPATRRAVRRLQRRRHLAVDGVAGPRTRRALGWRGRPSLGRRELRRGRRGWDVSELQFLLRRRGFSPGSVDGGFGAATRAAVRRFQRAQGLRSDGIAGPATIRALKHPRRHARSRARTYGAPQGPVRFLRPVDAPIGDGFGWVSGRRHTGIDFLAKAGAPVGAAGVGVVVSAGWDDGGYGNLVVVQHRLHWQTWYAHLSSIAASKGQSVTGGTLLGYVGSTGRATGPHLHFETRHHGVPVDPMPRLLP